MAAQPSIPTIINGLTASDLARLQANTERLYSSVQESLRRYMFENTASLGSMRGIAVSSRQIVDVFLQWMRGGITQNDLISHVNKLVNDGLGPMAAIDFLDSLQDVCLEILVGLTSVINQALRNYRQFFLKQFIEVYANRTTRDQKRAQDVLMQQVNQQASIIDSATVAIATVSLDGRPLYANQKALELFSCSGIDELTAMQFADIWSGDDANIWSQKVWPTVMETGSWQGEMTLLTMDGRSILVDQTLFLVCDEDKQPLLVATNLVDVSEREEGEIKQRNLAAALEERLQQVGALQRAMTHEGWQAYMTAQDRTTHGYIFDEDELRPIMDTGEVGGIWGTTTDAVTQLNGGENNSAMTTPMNVQGTTIGWIGARNPSGDSLTEEQRDLIDALSEQVAEALQRARLFEETELGRQELDEQASELSLLNEISEVVSTHLDLSTLFATVGPRLQEAFTAKSTYFALYNPTSQMIDFPYFYNEDIGIQHVPSRLANANGGFTARVIQARRPFIFNSIRGGNMEKEFLAQGGQVEGDRRIPDTYLGVPMVAGDEVIGVIGINSYHENRLYDEEDQRLLSTLAGAIGIAVQNARQFEAAQKRADREALINAISQKIQMAPTVQSAMQTAVTELGQALKLKRAAVELIADERRNGRNQPSQIELAGEPTHE